MRENLVRHRPDWPGYALAVTGGKPLGVQLHSVRREAAIDLNGVLAALAAIGYRTVELAGHLDRSPTELRAALDRAGLRCTSAHIASRHATVDRDLDDVCDRIAEDARVIGFDTVVVPMFSVPDRFDLIPSPGESISAMVTRITRAITDDEWQANVDDLNAKGRKLRLRGLSLAYHNHNVEFATLGDGTIMDLFLRGTDPALVSFQLDIGWAASAGVDAASLLFDHSGRFSALHLRDVKATGSNDVAMGHEPAEIGAGIIDWPRLLAAARKAEIGRFFVEQEEPFERPPLEALKSSFDYLACLSG